MTLDRAMAEYLSQPTPDAGMWAEPLTYADARRLYAVALERHQLRPTRRTRIEARGALAVLNAVKSAR